jgi:uncharacterized protein (TIGR00251 family)
MSLGVCRLGIRVQPRASKDQVVGWQGQSLKVRLTAPPVDGAANEALIAYLAKALGIPKVRIQLLRGETGREKVVEIGLEQAEVLKRLGIEASPQIGKEAQCHH